MKRNATLGVLGTLVIAATVGVSMQNGANRGGENDRRETQVSGNQVRVETSNAAKSNDERACDDIAKALKTFLAVPSVPVPPSCKAGNQNIRLPPLDLHFVIATLPDPVHTHLALTFDRMIEVVQDAAQDEGYWYEASWLPWDDRDQAYRRLADQDAVDDRKGLREGQPGILVFRNTSSSHGGSDAALEPYQKGLVVFVVGEDPTRGIHEGQFTNALSWIDKLKASGSKSGPRLAILGPTFSGSFPSLAKLMSTGDSYRYLQDIRGNSPDPLTIYSGTANSGKAISAFEKNMGADINFHSFMERDEVGLDRYCQYAKPSVDPSAIAVISEDETAYGGNNNNDDDSVCLKPALWLYYPRDISALRAAYQKDSIFSATTPEQSSDIPRNGLPTDLADPEGNEHDTVRSYAGNQTPLSQEAYMLGIVNELRVRHIDYVILRSTNPLDQLFLSTYLRRAYPEARIITDGADRLFEREQGATQMRGTMTLSTYPLLEDERDWIAGDSPEIRESLLRHRSFNSDTSEGTYNALRLLLHTKALGRDPTCALSPEPGLPILSANCKLTPPLPDYGLPSWLPPGNGGKGSGAGERPATWLSVLANEGFWAIAALNDKTIQSTSISSDGEGQTKVPVSLKVFVILLGGFIGFHLWCCWQASFTAKPAFRTHFANVVEWKRHVALICLGSCFVAFLPLLVGWGCGAFDPSSRMLAHGGWLLSVLLLEGGIALAAGPVNILRFEKLESASGRTEGAGNGRPKLCALIAWTLGGSAVLVALFFVGVVWLQKALLPASRFFTYYRNMHIMSGASSIVPLVALSLGMYAWFWHSLHGLALFGPDRCQLPKKADPKFPDPHDSKNLPDYLRMFSQEAADPTELGAKPFDRTALLAGAVFLVLIIAFVCTVPYNGTWPVRTLVAKDYAYVFLGWVLVCFSLLFIEAWQLLVTWTRLRALLVFLDRTPLRRTLAALRGFSWGTVWGISGNVLDVRYKLLSRQLESLGRARTAIKAEAVKKESDAARCCIAARSCIAVLMKLKEKGDEEEKMGALADECLDALRALRKSAKSDLGKTLDVARDCIAAQKLGRAIADPDAAAGVEECISALEKFVRCDDEKGAGVELRCVDSLYATREAGMRFAAWYAKEYNRGEAGFPEFLEAFQSSVAETAATLWVGLLVPEWRREKNSLILEEAEPGAEVDKAHQMSPPLSEKQHIRNAEEFVCLPYLGFVQNILGRIRSMVMSILWLFVAITLAVSSYPFDPREGLSATLLAVFLVLGAVIVYVYWQMHEDATLSRITNTTPGELGIEFWSKLVSFGIAPLLGLLTTHFPGIADFVFSWLQPGLQSIK